MKSQAFSLFEAWHKLGSVLHQPQYKLNLPSSYGDNSLHDEDSTSTVISRQLGMAAKLVIVIDMSLIRRLEDDFCRKAKCESMATRDTGCTKILGCVKRHLENQDVIQYRIFE